MAKSILDKLNLLVRASVEQVIGTDPQPKPRKFGTGLARELDALRAQLAAADATEIALRAELASLEAELVNLDRQADAALSRGNEAQARHLIEQLQRGQQRRAMLESEIDSHQRAVRELFAQLNQIEALEQAAQEAAKAQAETTTDGDEIEALDQPAITLSEAIQKARSNLEAETRSDEAGSINTDQTEAAQIEQDLDQRRARLAKPDTGRSSTES